jgi:lipid-binding SYLF domain-containing protein
MSRATALALAVLLVMTVIVPACKSAEGTTPDEKRQSIDAMADDSLAELFRQKPETNAIVKGAAGYAIFSNMGMKILVLASGNGYGKVHDNATGKATYMKMRELGVGVGLGVEDFKGVFVFHSKAVLDKFVETGWEWSGDASAAAKSEETGGTLGADARTNQGISVYRFTESGIALMAAVTGTKHWKDEELN